MRVLLLDSASLYWRAFHALPESLVSPSGHPVNAVRGFLDTVAKIMQAREPDRVVACRDEDWRPQWRVDLVPTYKAHRLEEVNESRTADEELVPETLGPQIPWIEEVSSALGFDVIGAPECEADDVIATLALRHAAYGDAVDIASGDRDLVQLVDDRITLLYTGGTSASRGGKPWVELDPESVLERFNVPPQSYALMAVLRGDPSDGLPGVRGIGAKTAVSLVHAYPDFDSLVRAANEPAGPPMTPRLASAIIDHADVITASLAVTALGDRPAIAELPPGPRIDGNRARYLGEQLGVDTAVNRVLAAWEAVGRT